MKFRAAAQDTLPLPRLSGWLGAGRLAPAFRAARRNIVSDSQARAGRRAGLELQACPSLGNSGIRAGEHIPPACVLPVLSQLLATCLRRVGEGQKHQEGPATPQRNGEDGTGERGAGGSVTFAIVFLKRRGAEAAGGT